MSGIEVNGKQVVSLDMPPKKGKADGPIFIDGIQKCATPEQEKWPHFLSEGQKIELDYGTTTVTYGVGKTLPHLLTGQTIDGICYKENVIGEKRYFINNATWEGMKAQLRKLGAKSFADPLEETSISSIFDVGNLGFKASVPLVIQNDVFNIDNGELAVMLENPPPILDVSGHDPDTWSAVAGPIPEQLVAQIYAFF